MDKNVMRLFIAIDKICGGDGDPERLQSDLRKIEKKKCILPKNYLASERLLFMFRLRTARKTCKRYTGSPYTFTAQ